VELGLATSYAAYFWQLFVFRATFFVLSKISHSHASIFYNVLVAIFFIPKLPALETIFQIQIQDTFQKYLLFYLVSKHVFLMAKLKKKSHFVAMRASLIGEAPL